jgi:hypothetical protein
MPIYKDTPYVFTPDPENDNGPQIQSLLKAGYRWLQINGPECPIGTTVLLNRDDNWPYSGQIIEPAPGIDKVTIDVSGVGRNSEQPTDPSYAGIDYQGNVRPGSYLTAPAYVNTTQISVADTTPYTNGSWIVISDASTDFETYSMPLDGPLEVRQVIYVLADSLILNRVIKRDHPENAIVALCEPIKNVYIRNLEFTGNATIGLHLHYAQHCVFENITSVDWTGRCMLLLDNGGEYNTILNSYCTATEPGIESGQTAWGVVIEGQDGGLKEQVQQSVNFSALAKRTQSRFQNIIINGRLTEPSRSACTRFSLPKAYPMTSSSVAETAAIHNPPFIA